MGVESVFEMYTFLWGWHQYNAIWNILLDTGLAFIPFLGMLFNAFIQTFTSQDSGEASFASLRVLEINFISALFVIIIAAQPIVSVDLNELEFVSICVGEKLLEQKKNIPEQRPPNAIGFERLDMNDFNSVKLPAWWYGVLSVSHGIVHAAKKGLPCINDIRQLRVSTYTHDIKDIDLLTLLTQFGHECYLPALGRFIEDEKDPSRVSDNLLISKRRVLVDAIRAIFGKSDINWMGSQTLVLTPGYYDVTSIQRPGANGELSPVSCKIMWGGLIARVRKEFNQVTIAVDPSNPSQKIPILEHMKKVFEQKDGFNAPQPGKPDIHTMPAILKKAIIDFVGGDDQSAKVYVRDQSVMRAILDENIAFDAINFENDPTWGFYHSYNRFAEKWGQTLTQVSHYGTVDAFIKSVPFVGALILMCIYIFLPLAIVFASYSFKFLIIGAIGLFGAKFMFYLWHLAWWLDQNFLLMVSRSDGALGFFFQSSNQPYEVTIGLVVTSLYFALPLLWTMVISWTSFGVADAFSSSLERATPAQAIGQKINMIMGRYIYRGAQTATHYGISIFQKGKNYLMLHRDTVKQTNADFKSMEKYLEKAERTLVDDYKRQEKVTEVNASLKQRLDDAYKKYGPLDK